MFIVVSGQLGETKVGESIGSQNLLSILKPSEIVKAVGETLLYRLSKVSFVKVLKTYRQDRTNAYETFLKTEVPFTFPEYVVKDMSTLLLEQFYPRSEVVYKSGDSECDHFYIVYEGELTATAELSIP